MFWLHAKSHRKFARHSVKKAIGLLAVIFKNAPADTQSGISKAIAYRFLMEMLFS